MYHMIDLKKGFWLFGLWWILAIQWHGEYNTPTLRIPFQPTISITAPPIKGIFTWLSKWNSERRVNYELTPLLSIVLIVGS